MGLFRTSTRGIELKSPAEIESLRASNRIVASVLSRLVEAVRPGVTTGELDRMADRLAREAGARPVFLGYLGYTKSLCASVNREVVHGVPRDDRVLREGDIVGLDFGVEYQGWVGDSALTVPVGQIPASTRRLLDTTRECLERAIAACQPGGRLGDIGAAIQQHAESRGYSVVRDFVGHGIGRRMHEEPQVPNWGTAGTGVRLRAGMVLAIEPMINEGSAEVRVLDDGWTAVTVDGGLSAHYEHSVAITEAGPVVLSRREGEVPPG